MKHFSFHSRPIRLASCIAFVAALTGVNAAAQSEQEELPDASGNTPESALLQYSTLTASGSTISAVWVPVIVNGATKYVNVTIPLQFASTSAGKIVVTAGTPTLISTPPSVVSGFKQGTYVGPSTVLNGKMIVTVAGPGSTAGGATVWTLKSAAGAAECTYPVTAYWYDGPLGSNPGLEVRIAEAKINNSTGEWSLGVGGDDAGCSSLGNGAWLRNSLIGASQAGNSLTLVSFTDSFGNDHSTPQDTVIYQLQ